MFVTSKMDSVYVKKDFGVNSVINVSIMKYILRKHKVDNYATKNNKNSNSNLLPKYNTILL